jgi:hypothetical protein
MQNLLNTKLQKESFWKLGTPFWWSIQRMILSGYYTNPFSLGKINVFVQADGSDGPSIGPGQNLLGCLLMVLRDKLRESTKDQ